MPIKILLAVPTLSRYDRLSEMLRTVAQSTRLPNRILIVDNGGKLTREHLNSDMKGKGMSHVPTDLYQPQSNLGVAGSVNFALRNTPDNWWWLHSNDDVEFDPDCIRRLASAAEAVEGEAGHHFCLPEHGVGSAFTVFLVHSKFRDVAGYFDEVFFPAYFEDNSLGRRMNLVGVKRIVAQGAAYLHHTSSTKLAYTPAQMDAHHRNFRRNAEEYVRMWGGPPDQERYEIPYDGKYGHNLYNIAQWAVHEAPKD